MRDNHQIQRRKVLQAQTALHIFEALAHLKPPVLSVIDYRLDVPTYAYWKETSCDPWDRMREIAEEVRLLKGYTWRGRQWAIEGYVPDHPTPWKDMGQYQVAALPGKAVLTAWGKVWDSPVLFAIESSHQALGVETNTEGAYFEYLRPGFERISWPSGFFLGHVEAIFYKE
jgi:hypothetical protein